MSGRKRKYEYYNGVKVEMDLETGLPLISAGRRWEVVKSGHPVWPLTVQLMSRDGRILKSERALASEGGVRIAALSIVVRDIRERAEADNISRLVGTYPPKVL